jgi:hypothetical protein
MSDTDPNSSDPFIPSVGFVLTGVGVAASFMHWHAVVRVGPVESLPGLIAAGLAFAAFAARRYGRKDRRLSAVAGVASGGLALVAVFALLYPPTTNDPDMTVGIGVWIGFTIGVLGLAVAYADWLRLSRRDFLLRARFALTGLTIGITGLFGGFVFSGVGVALLGEQRSVLQWGVSTVTFSIGLGVVAVGYLVSTDRDFSFIDLDMLSRRDWGYVIGGVLSMFIILGVIAIITTKLGVPSTQHTLIDIAKEQPHILLYFIPLSWLAIGPGEELLSRNIIQKVLYEAYSRRSAILVATLVFTVIHLPAYATGGAAATFATLIRLFSISLVLGVVYERTENILVAALVHGTYDAIQFGLAYLAISGGYI